MTDRFVCSDASAARGETVVATASQVRAWLLVEVAGAWGVDAVADSELGPHVPAGWLGRMQQRGTRVICIRRGLDDESVATPAGACTMYFVVPTRPGAAPAGRAWTRTAPLLAAVTYLTDGLDPSDADPPAGWEPTDERLVLVCTNGRHDQCCATRGRPVVRHLRTSPWAGEVWECSHIGGDRFAANVVVLPDSLYFGRCDGPEAEQLLADHAARRIALDWFRGRSTYRVVEQAAEHGVRLHFGIDGLDAVRVVDRPQPDVVRLDVDGVGRVAARLARTTVHVDEPVTCRGRPNQDIARFDVVAIDLEAPA